MFATPSSPLTTDTGSDSEEESMVQIMTSPQDLAACLEDNKRCIVYFTAV